MNKSKIEWTDVTWNPVTGCTKVSSGCRSCYAERMANRGMGGWEDRKFSEIRCYDERLSQPLHLKKPCKIFVCSMGDLFHEKVSDQFIGNVFYSMSQATRHRYIILTKRPKRMREFITSSYPYIWLGVSVEDQATADERIPLLLQTPAVVRFVSYEPALAEVDFKEFLEPKWYTVDIPPPFEGIGFPKTMKGARLRQRIDWVIAGGESGPGARPANPDWFRSVRDQCKSAGVPFFMKQLTKNGRKIQYEDWPEDLKIREMPENLTEEK